MAVRPRRLINLPGAGAGLAALAGAGGRGIAKAGEYGSEFYRNVQKDFEASRKHGVDASLLDIQQDKLTNEEDTTEYNKSESKRKETEAKVKEKALNTARLNLNKANNPKMAEKLDDATMKLVDLPKAEKREAKSTFIDKEDNVWILNKDGSKENTKIKSKDWNKGKTKTDKNAVKKGWTSSRDVKADLYKNDKDFYERLAVNGGISHQKINGEEVEIVNTKMLNNLRKNDNVEIK